MMDILSGAAPLIVDVRQTETGPLDNFLVQQLADQEEAALRQLIDGDRLPDELELDQTQSCRCTTTAAVGS